MTNITISHANQIETDADAAISAGVESYADVERFLQGDHGALAEALDVASDDPRIDDYISAVQNRVADRLGW